MANVNKSEDMMIRVRDLKSQGFTYDEIALRLGVSKAWVNFCGRPRPGERICTCCCRKLKKRKE